MSSRPVKVRRGDRELELVPLKTWRLGKIQVGLFQDPESGKKFIAKVPE